MSVGDYEAAKKYATKESEAALDMMASSNVQPDEPFKFEIGDETISENKATVFYKQNGEDRVLKLSKEEGKWKVGWSKSDMEDGPAQVGEEFLMAMAKGDIDKAKKYATQDAQASLDMMAGTAEAKKANPDRIEIGDIKVAGDKATLSYKENGSDKTLDLVKENGKWKAAWSKGSGGGLEDLGQSLEGAMEEAVEVE